MKKAIISAVLGFAVVAFADDGSYFKTSAARDALTRYQAAMTKADQGMADAHHSALVVYAKALTDAKASAMKANNLDEANRIEAALKDIQSDAIEAKPSMASAALSDAFFSGAWEATFSDRGTRKYVFNRNGTALVDGKAIGKWKAIGSYVILDDGNVERLKALYLVAPDKMFVETTGGPMKGMVGLAVPMGK